MTFANRKFIRLLGAATVVIVAEYVLVLSDCVISGRVLGETALGAMNLLMPVFSTVSFFPWLLAVGTSIVYADAIGRMEAERAAGLAGQGLAVAGGMGIALAALAALAKGPYLAFMAPDAATVGFAGAYWTWYPLVAFLESVDMLLLYLVYTDGGERACLVSYVGQVVVNVAGSYWLCTRIGMAGISLGTVFAYVVGIAALLPRLLSRSCGLRFRFHFVPRDLARSLRASFGDASAGLFHALLFFVVTKYVLSSWGPSLLPVAAIVFCVVRLTVFFNGVGIALQPLETVYHGEGNDTAVVQLVCFAAVVSLAEGFLIALLMIGFPGLVIALVGLDDARLLPLAEQAVRLTAVGLPGYAIVYMFNSHFQYVGRPGRSLLLTAGAFFLAPVFLVLLMGWWLGLEGVWLAVAAGPLCALLPLIPSSLKVRTGDQPVGMRTVRVGTGRTLEAAERSLDGLVSSAGLGEPLRQSVFGSVRRAVRRIAERNPSRKICVEVSLDRRGEVKVTVRDDGVPFALDDVGAPRCRHAPAAGFNRNVLAWPFGRNG